jgi:hypothetical protein
MAVSTLRERDQQAVEWLLASDEPGIVMQIRRDVLGQPVSLEASAVLRGPMVSRLVAGQQSDGGFGVHPYQKWNGAHWRVVYTSRGVLGWLPDIRRWAEVVAHFVKPGGIFYITEVHPVAQVFDDEEVTPGELRLRYPYWEHERPLTFDVQGSYADREAPTEGLVEHSWDHALGEIVTALIDAGLRIDFLHEFDFAEWAIPFLVASDDGKWRLPSDSTGELPLFFSLKATKPA